ncbi:MAG: hypothetical protein ACOC35_14615 [Promethearchaeia archaeon]
MIQAILSYQFVLNQNETTGEIEPEFRPLQLVFNNDDFSEEDYSDLIVENDIFAIFYQHTTGIYGVSGDYSNFYSGRLKETPYQVFSYFKQTDDGSQFLAISIFELDDDIEIFEKIIRDLANKLNTTFETLLRARNSRQLSLITKTNEKLEEQIKFTIFQVERLSNLDKLQKAALIFHSDERMKILELLRQYPRSKRQVKYELEKLKPNPNIDILIEPFLELNLIRRDWIKGKTKKGKTDQKHQGEYLFLTKDIILTRIPPEQILEHLKEKESKSKLYPKYKKQVFDYFSKYDPLEQTPEEIKKLAGILLNPDIYDFFALMRSKYYPLNKIPKILSQWAETDMILNELKELDVITEINDKDERAWLLLLTDIKPMIVFPEYLLPKIKEASDVNMITEEIAKKALDLLEVTYPEKVQF